MDMSAQNPQPLTTTLAEDNQLSSAVQGAIAAAQSCTGKLCKHVTKIDGICGRKYPFLINGLIERVPNARYLQIGSYSGSTFWAAISGNNV